ncbi:HAMP domain-containing sensor histidine kinase [Lachnospiraceae bacterium 45-W7]
MKKYISIRFFLLQWIFFVIMTICGALCYEFFFPIYYEHLKNVQVQNAYLDIEELDLAVLEDYSVFTGYEEKGLSFTIADEYMNPVYTTRSDSSYVVYKNIEMKRTLFSKDAQVIKRDSGQKEVTKLRVILTQDDMDYYVVIKDNIFGGARGKMSEQFLVTVFIITFGIGSFVMLLFSKRLTKPIVKLTEIAGRIAERDFSEKAEENNEYIEISRLARNINQISEQFQRSIGQVDESRDCQLRQNVRQERMERLQKDFIANVSHELKTPLAVISSQAEMIAYVGEEERKTYLSSIQEEVEKMSGLVSGLLNTTVMEHHMENVLLKTLNMKEIMEYIILKYDGLTKKKRIHLKSFLGEDCIVHGDREYIEQAVNNYMMNAIEHTEIDGVIRVTLRKEAGVVRIGVYNSGKQIPDKDVKHIWNGFYTKNQKVSAECSHAGLGLYIVQSVVTMHNGKYGVENLPEGVEFWFTIPETTGTVIPQGT